MQPRAVADAIRSRAAAAGIDRASGHSLRVGAAVSMAQRGASLVSDAASRGVAVAGHARPLRPPGATRPPPAARAKPSHRIAAHQRATSRTRPAAANPWALGELPPDPPPARPFETPRRAGARPRAQAPPALRPFEIDRETALLIGRQIRGGQPADAGRTRHTRPPASRERVRSRAATADPYRPSAATRSASPGAPAANRPPPARAARIASTAAPASRTARSSPASHRLSSARNATVCRSATRPPSSPPGGNHQPSGPGAGTGRRPVQERKRPREPTMGLDGPQSHARAPKGLAGAIRRGRTMSTFVYSAPVPLACQASAVTAPPKTAGAVLFRLGGET